MRRKAALHRDGLRISRQLVVRNTVGQVHELIVEGLEASANALDRLVHQASGRPIIAVAGDDKTKPLTSNAGYTVFGSCICVYCAARRSVSSRRRRSVRPMLRAAIAAEACRARSGSTGPTICRRRTSTKRTLACTANWTSRSPRGNGFGSATFPARRLMRSRSSKLRAFSQVHRRGRFESAGHHGAVWG